MDERNQLPQVPVADPPSPDEIDVTKPIVIDEVTITMLFDPEFPIEKPIE